MDLSNYKWPSVSKVDIAFPTFNAPKDLIEEANKRKIEKGRKKFNELFFNGGKIELKTDVKGTWKERAFMFARALMGSYAPSHEDKEAVCAMIFEECLIL